MTVNPTTPEKKIIAIIVGGGDGIRCGCVKQYHKIRGKAIMHRTIEAFITHDNISLVIPVIHKRDVECFRDIAKNFNKKLAPPVIGGAVRHDSCNNGLRAAAAYSPDIVLIHDAVRPFISQQLISSVSAVTTGEAIIPALHSRDTLKMILNDDPEHAALKTLTRNKIYATQTPQGFCFKTLMELRDDTPCGDDAETFEKHGKPIKLIAGDPLNLKITTPHDLLLADLIMSHLIGSPVYHST